MEGFNKVHAGCKSGPLKERQHPILHRAHQHEGEAFKSIKVAVSLYGAAAFFHTGGPLHQAVQKPKPGLLHHWPMAPEQLSPAQINSYVQDKMPKISSILSCLVRRGLFSYRPWLSHHHDHLLNDTSHRYLAQPKLLDYKQDCCSLSPDSSL